MWALRTAIAFTAFALSLPASSEEAIDVLLLGSDVRIAVLQRCGLLCIVGDKTVSTVSLGSSPFNVGVRAQRAKYAVIVINAPDGPMPLDREHILLAQAAGVPYASILLANVDLVDDGELLELIEMESRELLSKYDYPGDDAIFFYDAKPPGLERPVQNTKGLAGAITTFEIVPDRPDHGLPLITGQKITITIRSDRDTPEEVALSQGSPVTVGVNGHVLHGSVSLPIAQTDDAREVSIQLREPVSVPVGAPVFLQAGDILADGVVREIIAR